jgi:hypothetical protein
MTDEQIIDAASKAGLCFPTCWALNTKQENWSEQERRQMAYLRRFAERIKDL